MTKPTKATKAVESEQQVSPTDASQKQLEEPAHEAPPENPEISIDQTNINSLNTEPSSSL